MTKSVHSARYAKLVELLAEARASAGLTQLQVAEALGKPQSFVSKYEASERRLDVVELIEVSEELGVDPAGLVRRVARVGR